MAKERVQRRLAAILAADVVGYSRLMGQNEAGTLHELKAIRADVIDPKIAENKGRVFKSTGDGVLAEFPSVVNAVSCAVEIQRAMVERNIDLHDNREIHLRIGVNVGDVIIEGRDVFGDGVNVASRLEGIAPRDGVAISGTVRDHLGSRLDLQFEDMGEQTLRNIASPVRVYRLSVGRPSERQPAPVSHKPTIGVLPFLNMSGDAEQQYFTDGITEDIITELSRFHGLSVLARNSSFQFRDKSIDVRRIGQELGVQYLVEGSIRKANNNVRITAQLINASTGNHLWAERFDRALDDIFRLQDEVVHQIAARLEGKLATNLADVARRKPTQSMSAYDCVLQARQHLSTFDWAMAEPLLRTAVALDPKYAQAHAWLSKSIVYRYFFEIRAEFLDEALSHAQRAVTLDEDDATCHTALGQSYLWQRQFERAGVHYDRAMDLNPTDVLSLAHHCRWLTAMGRHQEALDGLDEVLRREPFPPSWYWEARAIALLAARRYKDGIDAIDRMSRLHYYNHAYLACCFAELGRTEEARVEVAEVLRLRPDFSIKQFMLTEPFKNPTDTAAEIASLRKAGLPD